MRRTRLLGTVWSGLSALAVLAGMTTWAWSADATEGKSPTPTELVFLCPDAQRQGIKLEIDGASMPVPATGLWQIGCRPGAHRISAKRDGCFPVDETVEVHDGQSATIALVWQPLPGNATIGGPTAAQNPPAAQKAAPPPAPQRRKRNRLLPRARCPASQTPHPPQWQPPEPPCWRVSKSLMPCRPHRRNPRNFRSPLRLSKQT